MDKNNIADKNIFIKVIPGIVEFKRLRKIRFFN